jgi:hypothetical protein
MSFIEFVFGKRRTAAPEAEILEHAPPGVWWREVRPRDSAAPVSAARADRSGSLSTKHGAQSYSAGDYIVDHGGGDEAVVRAPIFEGTYRSIGEGRYKKRSDLVLRYFTLERPVEVRTLEGVEHAAAGDWIMEGVMGELWPIKPDVGQRKYRPA